MKRVVVKGVIEGDDLLVKAFYFDELETDINTVKLKMSEILPPHMIPDILMYIKTPPLLPSGKVDVVTLLKLDSNKSLH